MLDKIVELYTNYPGPVLVALLVIIAAGGTAGGIHINNLRETIEDQRLAYEHDLSIERSRSKLAIEQATKAKDVCSDALDMLGAKVRTYDASRTRMEEALASMEAAIVPGCKAPSVVNAIDRLQREIGAVAADAEAVARLSAVLASSDAQSQATSSMKITRPSGYSTVLWSAGCVLFGIFIAVLYGRVRRTPHKPK